MSVVATIAQDSPYWCRCIIVPMDVNCGGQGSLALLVPGTSSQMLTPDLYSSSATMKDGPTGSDLFVLF